MEMSFFNEGIAASRFLFICSRSLKEFTRCWNTSSFKITRTPWKMLFDIDGYRSLSDEWRDSIKIHLFNYGMRYNPVSHKVFLYAMSDSSEAITERNNKAWLIGWKERVIPILFPSIDHRRLVPPLNIFTDVAPPPPPLGLQLIHYIATMKRELFRKVGSIHLFGTRRST